MKKVTLFILCATMIACNKNADNSSNASGDTKSNNVVWAENMTTVVPLEKDSMVTIDYRAETNKYDKKTIFESVKSAVLKGKLKAFNLNPDEPFTIEEFKKWLTMLDSGNVVANINHPGEFMIAPITSDDIVQLRFDERIELDTTTYTFKNKIYGVTFISNKRAHSTGEIIGFRYLFAVKFNDMPVTKP